MEEDDMSKSKNLNCDQKIVVHVDEDIKEIMPEFIENMNKNSKSILESLSKEDYNTIETLGHRMKGSGSGYGLDYITDLGSSLERAAKNKNNTIIQREAGKLVAYLERVEIVYE